FVEIGLTALGYYTGAVECPGVFGSGLEDAVYRFQKDTNLNEDKIAGRNVMDMMLRRLGCI
ncbi:peptidoglycan-binding domain-containing protein, partial [[Clostridium] scindens]|uniref:peptidoglycan-binding domain-containing protein n=1 Tax=Clostridium scindens (strain JCM 10418 / VPI 12708) TaxID=29347 RepID=UPI00242B95DD